MKVKVIRDFIDKHTKVYCPVGMTREVSQERYAEIQAAGDFVQVIPEPSPAEPVQNEDGAEVVEPVADVQNQIEHTEPPKKTRRSSKK